MPRVGRVLRIGRVLCLGRVHRGRATADRGILRRYKTEHCFGFDHGLAFTSRGRGSSARRPAHSRSDGGSLTPARQAANDRPQCCSATDFAGIALGVRCAFDSERLDFDR